MALAAGERGDGEQRAHRDLRVDAAMRQRAFERVEHRRLAGREEAPGDRAKRTEPASAASEAEGDPGGLCCKHW